MKQHPKKDAERHVALTGSMYSAISFVIILVKFGLPARSTIIKYIQ